MDHETLKPFFEPFPLDLIDDGHDQYLVRVTKAEYDAALASYQKVAAHDCSRDHPGQDVYHPKPAKAYSSVPGKIHS